MKKKSNDSGVNKRTPNKRQKKETVKNKVKVTHKAGVPNVFTVDLWK